MSPATQAPSGLVDDALDRLVEQFSEPLSFYRELIQNAVDAGSRELDVRMELQEERKGAGKKGSRKAILTIHVDDYGEGMNREIIDSRLTRLFSSAKDGDFTKIGRFGIGFVSVFAIEPDAVVVDTSRDGENWRVLFEKDRSFTRIERDEPVEGTKIRILKRIRAREFDDLVKRSRDVISYWCKHVAGEIRFQGETLNEPFEVQGPCRLHHEESGTEVSIAYAGSEDPFFGFYNRGLTLLEGKDTFFSNVRFKVSSRYLEHTLTRDNVLRDRNFDKAMKIVGKLVARRLPDALFTELERHVTAGPEVPPETKPWFEALASLLGRAAVAGRTGVDLDDFDDREVFCAVDGAGRSIKDLRKAHERGGVFIDTEVSPVSEALVDAGGAVVFARRDDPVCRALQAMIGALVENAREAWCLPVLVDDDEHGGGARLAKTMSGHVRFLGANVRRIARARFGTPGSPLADRLVISQEDAGKLSPMEDLTTISFDPSEPRRDVCINVDHPTVRKLEELATREPEIAAYLAVTLMFDDADLVSVDRSGLAERSWSQRCRRLKS